MKVLAPEVVNKDGRRTLTQLFTADIKQVNEYHAKKGTTLGDHYHATTTEYFHVTKGTLLANGEPFSRGSTFVFYPPQKHVIECLTDVSFLTFLSEPYDELNPDLHR